MTSEFTIQDMLPIAITLVVLGIAVSYGLSVMSDIEEDLCDDGVWDDGMCWNCDNVNTTYSYNGSSNFCEFANTDTPNTSTTQQVIPNINKEGQASNATRDSISAVAKIPEKLPLIVTVIIAAIIIGIIVRYLFTRYT